MTTTDAADPGTTQAPFPAAPPLSTKVRDWRVLVVKLVVGIAVLAVLYELPLLSARSTVERMSEVLCFAIAALGLNLLTGYNGQISIGHGAFMGIGAYATAILVSEYGWSPYATVPVGALVAFVVGLIVGLPALRIKGVYLALVTLALATLFPQFIIKFKQYTGGTQGISLEPEQQVNPPSGVALTEDQWRYYLILGVALVAFLLVRNLVKSRVGRALVSVRDNEVAAEVLGVNVGAYKVLTFGVSAMLAAIAGSLLVFNSSQVSARTYGVQISITLLVMVVVGGVATTFGPAVGALVVTYLPTYIPGDNKALSPVIFGLLLILLMMVAPGGIVGFVKMAWAWLRSQLSRSSRAGEPEGAEDADEAEGSRPPAASNVQG